MRAKVLGLEAQMRDIPQIEPVTNHYFADGLYARELIHPAGALIVGKVHRREHFFIVTKGSVRVVMDDGVRILRAPHVMVSSPGTKRALFSEEGCVYMTVHRTNKKNIEKIEKELVEDAPLSPFGIGNKLKVLK